MILQFGCKITPNSANGQMKSHFSLLWQRQKAGLPAASANPGGGLRSKRRAFF